MYFKVYACLSISSLNDKLKIHSSMCMCWLLQMLNFYIHHNKNTNQIQRLYVCLLLQLSEYPLLLKVKNYLQCSTWITSICLHSYCLNMDYYPLFYFWFWGPPFSQRSNLLSCRGSNCLGYAVRGTDFETRKYKLWRSRYHTWRWYTLQRSYWNW